jgi:hypothetical protein
MVSKRTTNIISVIAGSITIIGFVVDKVEIPTFSFIDDAVIVLPGLTLTILGLSTLLWVNKWRLGK